MDASAVHSRSIYQSTVTLRLAVIVSSFFHAVFFDTHVLPMFVRRHMASGVAEQSNASCGTRAPIRAPQNPRLPSKRDRKPAY